MPFESINPATNEVIKTYPFHSRDEVDVILKDLHEGFLSWRRRGFAQRGKYLKKVSDILQANKKKYAQLMAKEMGKPVSQGIGEIEKCALVCDYYIKEAEGFLKPQVLESDATKSYAAFEPLGVIFAIMPWNFPFWQVFRFLAPGLMAGNTGVLKHAQNVSGCALAIDEIIHDAGFPDNVFRSLIVDNDGAAQVIKHPAVKAVTLTGSTKAGQSVAATAGSVLKKVVLELGGSDPYVILEDADVNAAAESCVTSRLINSGQSCIAAKRFIVVESLKKAFEEKVVSLMQAKKTGDPFDDSSDLGPMARMDLRDGLHEQVEKSVEQGAKLLLGGKIPAGDGAYYPPTVLGDVAKGMAAYEEELFGPVASIIPVKDEEQAIEVANDSVFGLGAAVFSQDTARAEKIAKEEIQSGACFVNDFVRSDPRLPFGGIKESGYGRELSYFGIQEFVNIKTVYVK